MSEEYRDSPDDALDLNLMLTNPEWGKAGSGPDFDIDPSNVEDFWKLLRFYGRDIRLSNLESKEVSYCTHYLDLATDLLKENMKEAFIISLGRVATVTETSQGRKGFLRKQQNTITQELKSNPLEPSKKNIVTGKPKGSE